MLENTKGFIDRNRNSFPGVEKLSIGSDHLIATQ